MKWNPLSWRSQIDFVRATTNGLHGFMYSIRLNYAWYCLCSFVWPVAAVKSGKSSWSHPLPGVEITSPNIHTWMRARCCYYRSDTWHDDKVMNKIWTRPFFVLTTFRPCVNVCEQKRWPFNKARHCRFWGKAAVEDGAPPFPAEFCVVL